VICYFDTSALVALLVEEPGSESAASTWLAADRVASVRLVYPEARAALARARRDGRISATDLRFAVGELDTRLDQLEVVDITESLARRAGDLAETHQLRGYDAVHLAAADLLRDDDLVLVSGDGPLLGAASALGLAVARTR
jgi:predicted nucleic acid-binding protein